MRQLERRRSFPNAVGHAIWSTLDPPSHIAEGMNDLNHVPQEVVVSLPVHPDALEPVAVNAAEVLVGQQLVRSIPQHGYCVQYGAVSWRDCRRSPTCT